MRVAHGFPHFPNVRDMFDAHDAIRAQSAEMSASHQVAYLVLAVHAVALAAAR
jgi:hypothetical protein